MKKIVQNGFFLQSEIEPVGSFLVVTFHQPFTVDKELISFASFLFQLVHLRVRLAVFKQLKACTLSQLRLNLLVDEVAAYLLNDTIALGISKAKAYNPCFIYSIIKRGVICYSVASSQSGEGY